MLLQTKWMRVQQLILQSAYTLRQAIVRLWRCTLPAASPLHVAQSLQDENLVTDVGQEHDKFNVYNDMGNQDHANQIYYQNENSGKNNQKFNMII